MAVIAVPGLDRGLSHEEVEQRRAAGQVNTVARSSSRDTSEILRSNLFTRFNALVVGLAVVVAMVGDLIDLTFVGVMVLNSAIGIYQELRAKRTLDRLSVLVAAPVGVVRDGAVQFVAVGDVVLGDHVLLSPGDQIPVDGTVLVVDGLEADESSLTGEAEPVAHAVGEEVRSGSSVVAGTATIVATRVGADAWARQLEAQAREFDAAHSELRSAINNVLRAISWMVPPLGGLLLWSQLRNGSSVEDGLVSASAGIVALVPQGLVLLVSATMATAVVRLARNQVVVRELPAVEGLARVDVICLDKTGTLTTGKIELQGIEPVGRPLTDVHAGLAALIATATSTPMFELIAQRVGPAPGWDKTAAVAFSSARKWSAASFTGHGTWVLGAPEIILESVDPAARAALPDRVEGLAVQARRVLMLATSIAVLDDSGELPGGLVPAALVVMNEELRPDAADTMRYFVEQGVTVKVISGDNPATVSAIARALGIPGAERFVDMRHEPRPMSELVDEITVFGRVQPEQKRGLVEALQSAGHTVAMTGDGVNDIPALKAADIAIAMDTATPSTKAVSELVLLNGRFDLLPSVVAEGRRVIANMERVSSLFVTKTVYATLFAIVTSATGVVYPFLPRHLSLNAELTIGVPAFLLGFRPSNERCRPGYLRRVARFSVPAGAAVAVLTMCAYGLLRSSLVDASLVQARTGATAALATCSFWILYRLIRPLDRFEAVLLIVLMTLFVTVYAVPAAADLYELELPPASGVAATAGLVTVSLLVLQLVLARMERSDSARVE